MSKHAGICKWFNATKGYGFIDPDDGGNDVFVHIRDIQDSGLDRLEENQCVTFDLLPSRNGKDSAKNISLI